MLNLIFLTALVVKIEGFPSGKAGYRSCSQGLRKHFEGYCRVILYIGCLHSEEEVCLLHTYRCKMDCNILKSYNIFASHTCHTCPFFRVRLLQRGRCSSKLPCFTHARKSITTQATAEFAVNMDELEDSASELACLPFKAFL